MILDDLNSKKRYVLSIASFTLQSIIGLFMGHHFDMQIFYVAGNAVSNGFAPYGIFYPSLIFNSPNFFERISGIGYPPPWGFFLGLVYMFVYEPTKNIYAYNLAIKIPSILSNIALAFIVERIAIQEGLRKTTTSRIFLFFLFNPLTIYISAIWGQFDSLVILTCILGLILLTNEKIILSSLLFAVSVSLKIIPFVLLPAMLLFIKRNYGLKQISEFILPFSIFSL
ncbi:MAG: glycosyltransferase 87 family protein, partial [Candidatus Bathyarchaeota archaeon]|nr:glycosyltransferase 87 family protein [Candidatus Bathyarchaeota archaeon]